MFRGFENVTPVNATSETGSGFIFSVLGGDDSGGEELWAPEVLQESRKRGLTLPESAQLVK